MTAIPMELPMNLPGATGSGQSKMAASKLQVRISQFVKKVSVYSLYVYRLFIPRLEVEL